jgi:hypothetical protein
MRVSLAQALALPVLFAAAVAATTLHGPGDTGSALADGGTDIYQAEVIGTASATDSVRIAYRPMSETGGVPAVSSPPSVVSSPAITSAFDVRGRPTVSVGLINRVLAEYGSPMAGEGEQLYQLGVKYGIDPAYCLAFFINESDAGTRGEAVLTHNLGNIRAVPGAASLDGFRYYATWPEGAEDWYRLIGHTYVGQWGLTTVSAIIPVYAPSGDSNDPAAYINNVEQMVSTWRTQR